MARPIEPTPTLEGAEAEHLLEEIENVCSPDEAKRRTEWARALLSRVLVPNADDRAAAE